MTINEVNGANKTVQTTAAAQSKDVNISAKASEKLNQAIADELTGANRKENDKSLTPNEKKALIKYYQECGYSRQEAEALFDSKAEKLEKMSRKDANAWCKNYMQENGVSEKEAKQAFEEQFGYSFPLNIMQEALRNSLVTLTPLGTVASLVDQATDGKLGIKKFLTGESNNDVAYIRRQ